MHSNHLTRHAEQVLTVTQGKTPHQYGPGADPSIAPPASSTLQIGAVRYDKDSGALYLNGTVMELTPRELALMHALLARPGHAVTKERLYELVFPGQLDVQYEAIEVVVYRLRKKLADTGLTLMTLRGLGYLIRTDP